MTETKRKKTARKPVSDRDEAIARWFERHQEEIAALDRGGHGIPARLKWPTTEIKRLGQTFAVPGLPFGGVYIHGRPSSDAELEFMPVDRVVKRAAL